jgi:hypothetical protein
VGGDESARAPPAASAGAFYLISSPVSNKCSRHIPLSYAVQTTTWLALAIRHENPVFVYMPSTMSRL